MRDWYEHKIWDVYAFKPANYIKCNKEQVLLLLYEVTIYLSIQR